MYSTVAIHLSSTCAQEVSCEIASFARVKIDDKNLFAFIFHRKIFLFNSLLYKIS